jgi:hypothetical protein
MIKKSIRTCLLITVTILLSSSSIVYSQSENIKDIGLNKNAIYGNVGIGGLYLTATGYYERIITQNNKISSFVKAGVGGYALWGIGGQYILAQYGILTGAKKHHLELGVGPNYFLNGDLQGELPFTATLGWRIQKPRGKFIFRMGGSWPEAVYIGIGASF